MSTVKRPKLRNPVNVGPSVTVPHEVLSDFCRAFLRDSEVKLELTKIVRKKGMMPTSTANEREEIELPVVPLHFESATHYLRVFQALCLEEAKTDLFSHLKDVIRRVAFPLVLRETRDDDSSCFEGEKTRHCKLRATINMPDRMKKDWKEAESEQLGKKITSDGPTTPCGLSHLTRGDILILLTSPMAKRTEGFYETHSEFICLGVVSRAARPSAPSGKDNGGIELDVAVIESSSELLRNREIIAYHVSTCNIVTSWREWDGLNSLFSSKKSPGSSWSSPLIPALLACAGGSSSSSSSKTLETPKPTSTSETLIDFETNVVAVDAGLPLSLPGATPLYQSNLQQRYNPSQIEAIAATCSSKNGITLVQGPPGTGKTHTLLGLLNSLHLSVHQQCYERDLPDPFSENNKIPDKATFDWFSDRANPHLLIVAPSNIAIDNVLRLILTKGFLDGVGNKYIPSCIRIGSSNWNASRSNDDFLNACSLDVQVDTLLKSRNAPSNTSLSSSSSKASETDLIASRLRGLESEVRRLNKLVVEIANEHARTKSPEKLREFHDRAAEWVGCRNRARDVALELARRRLLHGPSTGGDGALRADMRALVLSQANLVFSTLSQCGAPSMTEIAPSRIRFQVCVVDEAAQAVEPSTVIPLSLGVERYVMVGDPNQLPATVLSERATRVKYQQSLFERLQRCGHPVHLLDVQYRCRPELSSFCSKSFYGGRLKDGNNVLSPTYMLPIHRYPSVGPLVFYNVAYGSQVRSESSSSFSNEAEANVCLDIYNIIRGRLRNEAISPLSQGPCHIAIISPYREQLFLLQRLFSSIRDENLEMNTVDGFQGREVDIVIFSCVRGNSNTSEDSGIGFLNDARRLNVAATRARFSFLIVGNYEVLSRGSRLWRSLIDNVKKKGKIVQVPQTGFDLF